ncbi:MAG TPA: lipid-binding SYLF domain-containing protein [Candidatus Saccharicenans sp.]|nr:lipid-binding SYLF domain-containing protein [Candidatus Saccharicenans sp.]HPB58523.1 lipid-binding SYLF domain-containing protein [Candidatus Saccharicenans sp.]HUM78710.1 lipid-binding SYLF domain-containing protein [Candidatus Saccharicenans sp.]
MNKKADRLISFLAISFSFLFLMFNSLLADNPPASRPGEDKIEKSLEVIKELAEMKDEGIPISLLKKAQGLAILPGVIKAAWALGGQYGSGIAIIKKEDGSWSNPLFIKLAGGSFGLQLGVQKADLVLVFKNRRGVEEIAGNKITLGADLSVSAGPIGRSAEASTDLEMEAEIYSYSKSKGLFAGLSLKGGSLQFDKKANRNFYDSDLPGQKILYEDLETPPVVQKLQETLRQLTEDR